MITTKHNSAIEIATTMLPPSYQNRQNNKNEHVNNNLVVKFWRLLARAFIINRLRAIARNSDQ